MASASYSEDTDSSFQRGLSVDEGVLLEEVELLEAIYISEIAVEKDDNNVPNKITLQLDPATGEDADKQYVCLTLILNIPEKYPFVLPEFEIKNPRGLADDHVIDIRNGLIAIANKQTGGPMLYEMIEFAKENLTFGNLPHGKCVICLEHFEDQDAFIKTECYHYFHCACAHRYIKHSLEEIASELKDLPKHKQKEEKQVVCPVCREPITYNLDYLRQNSDPNEEELKVEISKDIRQLQKKMATLLSAQKAKGGVIDLDEEKNKYLLTNESIIVPLSSDNTPENEVGLQAKKSIEIEDNGPVKGKGRGQRYRDYDRGRPGTGKRYQRSDYRSEKSYRHENFSDKNEERIRRNKNRERYRNERSHEKQNNSSKETERNRDDKETESKETKASKNEHKEKNEPKVEKCLEAAEGVKQSAQNERDTEKCHKKLNGPQDIDKKPSAKIEDSKSDIKFCDNDKKETTGRERGSGPRGRGYSRGSYRGYESGRGTRGRGQRGRYSDRHPREEYDRNYKSESKETAESQEVNRVKQNIDSNNDTRSMENGFSKEFDSQEKGGRKGNYNRYKNRDAEDQRSAGHRRYPRKNSNQKQTRENLEPVDTSIEKRVEKQTDLIKPPPGFKQVSCPPGFEKENASSVSRTAPGQAR